MNIIVEEKGETLQIFADEYLDGVTMVAKPASFSRKLNFTQDTCCDGPLLTISREIAWDLYTKLSNILEPVDMELLKKITCGATGHKFIMRSAFIYADPDGGDRHIKGSFECGECHLVVKRKLTDTEIKAAKVLNLIG